MCNKICCEFCEKRMVEQYYEYRKENAFDIVWKGEVDYEKTKTWKGCKLQ